MCVENRLTSPIKPSCRQAALKAVSTDKDPAGLLYAAILC